MNMSALAGLTNLPYLMTDQVEAVGQMLAKPYNFSPEFIDFRNDRYPSAQASGKRASEFPVTGQMAAFGAQGGATTEATVPAAPTPPPVTPISPPAPPPSPTPPPPPGPPPAIPSPPSAPSSVTTSATTLGGFGDPWDFTHKPGRARWVGGTANGGWLILPPESDPSMYAKNFVPRSNQEVSETYLMVGPGASFAAGLPDMAAGRPKSGISWGAEASTGDLVAKAHYAGTTAAVEMFRLAREGQTINWRSRTSFQGKLRHFNTADRTYDFPDITGSVVVWSASQELGGGTTAMLGTIGGSGPTVDTQNGWLEVWLNGTTVWIPYWR